MAGPLYNEEVKQLLVTDAKLASLKVNKHQFWEDNVRLFKQTDLQTLALSDSYQFSKTASMTPN